MNMEMLGTPVGDPRLRGRARRGARPTPDASPTATACRRKRSTRTPRCGRSRWRRRGSASTASTPGPTDTPMMPHFEKAVGKDFMANFPKPLWGRNARPDEQAWPLLFLNSPRCVVRDRRAVRRRRRVQGRHLHRPDRPHGPDPRRHALASPPVPTLGPDSHQRERSPAGREPSSPSRKLRGERRGDASADSAALDDHREREVAPVADEPRVGLAAGSACPNSAVPVLPKTPGGRPAPAAVPPGLRRRSP